MHKKEQLKLMREEKSIVMSIGHNAKIECNTVTINLSRIKAKGNKEQRRVPHVRSETPPALV